MKVLFINDSTSNPNWGDRAAAISLRAMISGVGGNIIASVSEHDLGVSTFFNESFLPKDSAENSVRAIIKLFLPPLVLRLRRKLVVNPDVTAANRCIPEKWESFEESAKTVLKNAAWQPLLKAIAEADVAVIHGDGAMVDNGIIPRTDLFLTYLAKTHYGKPVIIVNHTADFNHPDLLRMAKGVYPLFDDVVFRDQISAERCGEFCKGRFAADTAFWFKPAERELWALVSNRPTYFDVWPDTARFDPSGPYLCIGGSSKYQYEKRPFPIRRGYVSLVRHIRSLYKGQIVLTASDVTDQEMFRPIARELGLPLVGVTTAVQQAVDIVGNADAYVGGRWHPGIFALRGGAPVIPIASKTFKMQALAQMAGLPGDTFDVSNLDGEKRRVGRQLLSFMEMGRELRSSILMRAEELSENSWDNVAYLGS